MPAAIAHLAVGPHRAGTCKRQKKNNKQHKNMNANRSLEQQRAILINSPNPIERLEVILELRESLFANGSSDAAKELLDTIKNDMTGEVVIATAFACANPPEHVASKFREMTMGFFERSGDRSTSGGAPLLRLAYVAAFEKDITTLKAMVSKRDEFDTGVDRIQEVAAALESNNTDFVFRVMAWSEGLDRQYQPQFLQPLRVVAGADTFLPGLQSAVEHIRQTRQYRNQIQCNQPESQSQLAAKAWEVYARVLANQSLATFEARSRTLLRWSLWREFHLI